MNGYNFTERVRRVLSLAREEAAGLRHEYVGTEHILLGLMTEGNGVGTTVLTNLGIGLDDLRAAILEIVKQGPPGSAPRHDLPYTSRAKKVLEFAMIEARQLNHSYVGSEHLLLGLLREKKGMAAQVLEDAGLTIEVARQELLNLLGDETVASPPPVVARPRAQRRWDPARDPLPHFPERLRQVIDEAHDIAADRGSIDVTPAHLMIALIEHGDGLANAALDHLGLDRPATLRALNELAPPGRAMSENGASEPDVALSMTTGPEEVANPTPLLVAALQAMETSRRYARSATPGTHHLLIGLLMTSSDLAAVLASQNISLHAVQVETRRLSG